jgi:DNA-binding transcriptional LysR family regulator
LFVAIDRLLDLSTFVLVVRMGNMSAAARALRVTTNAISRRMQRLEAQVGARLLNRTTRRLSISDEGRLLYARGERVVRELEEAEAELGASRAQLSGTIRIALPAGGVESTLLGRLGDFLDEHPAVAIQLLITHGPVDVYGAGLDLAVIVGEPSPPSLVARRLGTVSWKFAASPRYLARHGRPRVPADLTAHRCLRWLSERPQLEWRLADARGRETVVEVRGTFECNDSRALADATYAGLGIGVRPDGELARAVAEGHLEAVLPAYRFAAVPVYAILPQGRLRLPRVAALLNVLKEGMQATTHSPNAQKTGAPPTRLKTRRTSSP